jgi:hypothetical protein
LAAARSSSSSVSRKVVGDDQRLDRLSHMICKLLYTAMILALVMVAFGNRFENMLILRELLVDKPV